MSPFRLFNAKLFLPWQIEAIGNNLLRDEDKRELKSLSGKTPGDTLVDSVRSESGHSWIAYAEDTRRPVAVFGYERSPNIPGVVIWMVATYQLYAYSKDFLRISKIILDNWLEKFGTLHNYIDIRNKVHIEWLLSLGFELPAGMTCNMQDGVPFQYFIKEK
jgi:hypothetical protein